MNTPAASIVTQYASSERTGPAAGTVTGVSENAGSPESRCRTCSPTNPIIGNVTGCAFSSTTAAKSRRGSKQA